MDKIMFLYNAGNFQEYDYECEFIDCEWRQIYNPDLYETHISYK